jgi:glycosyltransferase involved in cell wall biosynthesis
LRVAYIGHSAKLAGGEIGLVRLLQSTSELQATVVLAEDGPLVDALRGVGATVELLPLDAAIRELRRAEIHPSPKQIINGFRMAAYAGALSRRLRELRPSVVHANSLKAGVYGTVAARAAGIPCVWHLHDRLTADYLPRGTARAMRLAVRTLPDALVVPSQATLEPIGRPFRRGIRTAIIPLPVPMPERPATIREQLRTIGVVGRLTPWKGQHLFLDAFARAFPDGPVTARVIGSPLFGEHDYERRLHAQARELGIEHRVEFAGFIDDVASELLRLDLLVHSSVLPDPLATTVLEALATGVPLIAAAAGGHAERLVTGHNALLYPPGDAEMLGRRMQEAASDSALRARIAAGGRQVAGEFAPEVVVGRMLALYAELAA